MSIENNTKDVQQLVVNQLGVANDQDYQLANGQVNPVHLSTGYPNWGETGTVTVKRHLLVRGEHDTDNDKDFSAIEIGHGSSGESSAILDFHSSGATTGHPNEEDFDARVAQYKNGDMYVVNNRPADMVFNVSTSSNSRREALRINGGSNAGFIGIGSDNPQEKLHVNNGSIRVKNSGTVLRHDYSAGLLQLIPSDSEDNPNNATHCLALDPNEILAKSDLKIRTGNKYNADGSFNKHHDIAFERQRKTDLINADGSRTTTERIMRIIGNSTRDHGEVIIGSGGQVAYGAKLFVEHNVGNNEAVTTFRHKQAGDRVMCAFVVGSTTVGKIQHQQADADNNNVNQISLTRVSDYRLKEDIVELEGAIEKVKALKPCNFAWKEGGRSDGFIAHELNEVCPSAVFGEKDAMRMQEYEVSPEVYDENGAIVEEAVMGTREVEDHQGIDDTRLIPILTKALQEALAKIESLEARVDALENA